MWRGTSGRCGTGWRGCSQTARCFYTGTIRACCLLARHSAFFAPCPRGGADIGGEWAVGWQGGAGRGGARLLRMLGADALGQDLGRFGRQLDLRRGLDAEHVAERAQDAAGAGNLGEECGHLGLGQQVLELAGVAADVVVGAAGEPGAAGGEIGFFGCLDGARAGRAQGRQGVGFPACVEDDEAGGGAGDAVVGGQENGRTGGVMVHMRRQRRAHPREDRHEAVHDVSMSVSICDFTIHVNGNFLF